MMPAVLRQSGPKFMKDGNVFGPSMLWGGKALPTHQKARR